MTEFMEHLIKNNFIKEVPDTTIYNFVDRGKIGSKDINYIRYFNLDCLKISIPNINSLDKITQQLNEIYEYFKPSKNIFFYFTLKYSETQPLIKLGVFMKEELINLGLNNKKRNLSKNIILYNIGNVGSDLECPSISLYSIYHRT